MGPNDDVLGALDLYSAELRKQSQTLQPTKTVIYLPSTAPRPLWTCAQSSIPQRTGGSVCRGRGRCACNCCCSPKDRMTTMADNGKSFAHVARHRRKQARRHVTMAMMTDERLGLRLEISRYAICSIRPCRQWASAMWCRQASLSPPPPPPSLTRAHAITQPPALLFVGFFRLPQPAGAVSTQREEPTTRTPSPPITARRNSY